jgi:hypothetical protein
LHGDFDVDGIEEQREEKDEKLNAKGPECGEQLGWGWGRGGVDGGGKDGAR